MNVHTCCSFKLTKGLITPMASLPKDNSTGNMQRVFPPPVGVCTNVSWPCATWRRNSSWPGQKLIKPWEEWRINHHLFVHGTCQCTTLLNLTLRSWQQSLTQRSKICTSLADPGSASGATFQCMNFLAFLFIFSYLSYLGLQRPKDTATILLII